MGPFKERKDKRQNGIAKWKDEEGITNREVRRKFK